MNFGAFMSGPWGPLVAMAGTGILGSLLSPHDEQRRRARQRALFELDPATIGRNAEQFFNITQNSPGMAFARSQAIAAGQAGQGALQRHMGQTGLGRSGVGTAQLGAMAAAPGIHMAGMTADAWSQALRMAQANAGMRAQGQSLFEGEAGMGRALTAAALNAGIPYLMRMQGNQPSQRQAAPTATSQQSYTPQFPYSIGPEQVPWWQQQNGNLWGYP